MEKKVFSAFATKAEEQGIVEAIVAVMGNVDEGGDVIHPGSFAKTIAERLGKIKVLDAHRTDSTARVIGKPLEARELVRSELPDELLQRHPEACGGLWTRTQFLIDTPEGEGAFKRIKAGVLDEWSIGYDALDSDYSKITKDGKEITVRNLRTIKLYEYSPVLWGMNAATATLSAKEKPTEGKPYRAYEEGGVWRVYKLDENGESTGDPLGEHETEEEAQAQVRALYANEEDKCVRPTSRGEAQLDPQDGAEPNKSGRRMRRDKAELLSKLDELLSELRSWAEYEDEEDQDETHEPAPDKVALRPKAAALTQAAGLEPEAKGAGPSEATPTSNELLRLIEIEQEEMDLLEV
jgi:HK97 family phage prohead protease